MKTKIKSRKQNPQGFHRRYHITKINEDGIMHPTDPNSEYFVLRLDVGASDILHLRACRKAIHVYANEMERVAPKLAKDLRKRYPLI